MIKITECPRDAMQGVGEFIPTKDKIRYLQSILEVGFDILDFGSFVSPKAIPQLKDTTQVLEALDLSKTNTKLLAIVASESGGNRAANFEQISYLGFPFSISETFLEKNIKSNFEKVIRTTKHLHNICEQKNKTLLQYVSMAFGNPYGEEWSKDILFEWIERLSNMGIRKISLSDITAEASADSVFEIYNYLIQQYPNIEFGLHLHTSTSNWKPLVNAAYKGGCRGFDTVLNGIGGCPMSGKELLQNLSTYDLLSYFSENNIAHRILLKKLNRSLDIANQVFPQ